LLAFGARRGDVEQCREWLRRTKDHGRLPGKQHLLSDPDLASVRDEPWFREFLDEA
jgi:hypothetical protein